MLLSTITSYSNSVNESFHYFTAKANHLFYEAVSNAGGDCDVSAAGFGIWVRQLGVYPPQQRRWQSKRFRTTDKRDEQMDEIKENQQQQQQEIEQKEKKKKGKN